MGSERVDTETLAAGPPNAEHIEALVDEVARLEGRRVNEVAASLGWSRWRTSIVIDWCEDAGVLDLDDEGRMVLGAARESA